MGKKQNIARILGFGILKSNGVFWGLLVISIFSGVFGTLFLSPSASAYTASISTDNNLVLNASPLGDGTAISSSAINVISDCRSGYNLSISTSTSSSLYRYENGTKVSNTATFTAVDGTSALNSTNNNNKWGYTITNNPTGSTVFNPLSTTPSILKNSTTTADPNNNINDTFNIYFGVKTDSTIESGTYQMDEDTNNHIGTIVYHLTMDSTCAQQQYSVDFNPNGGTGTTESQNIQINQQAKLDSIESLTIKAPSTSTYTDADNNTIVGEQDKLWAFWGWNTRADGTGDWYKEREEVQDLATAGDTITLYAQWKQATLNDLITSTPIGTEKVIDHNTMQDMSPEACWNSTAYDIDANSSAHNPYDITNNPNGYHTITLNDYRGKVITDNPSTTEQPEQYTVTKLPDGLCWMTKNLDLGRESGGPNGDGTITLTPDDTDITANFTLPASTTSSSTTNTLPRIRTTNTNNNNDNGTYYSWAAAVANTTSQGSTYLATSICPKNWDLPTDTMYTNLKTKADYKTGNLTTSAPSNFLINGGFTNGATFYQTSYSHFWTNHSSGTSAAYGARVNGTTMITSSSTGTTYGGNKYYEKNIRCVASQGKVTINYDGNGTNEYPVTGSIDPQGVEIANKNSIYAGANEFTRNGWWFTGWNTAPDGSGVAISAGSNLSSLTLRPGDTVTLYAQWLPQYIITYVNNCMAYASANASCTQSTSDGTSTQIINLDDIGNGSGTLGASNYNSWTLTGWKIKGWSIVADNTSGTNTEYVINSTYSVVGASTSVPSGITLYAHWAPSYAIQYDGNGADNTNGMGATDANGIKSVKQTNVGEGDPIDLLASNFKRAGYGFIGWSTDSDAWTHFTDNDNTNDPIIYGPMETIEAPAYSNNATNTITMYAVWVPALKSNPSNPNSAPVYLQEWDDLTDPTDGCATLTKTTFDDTITNEKNKITVNKNSIIALTDKRDNMVYAIAKLADDNCWMIENLRLDNQYTMGQNQNDNTVTNESLSQGYGGTPGQYGMFVGLANSESANFTDTTTSNTVYQSSANPPTDTYNPATSTLEDIGTSNYPIYRLPRYNNINTYSLLNSPTYTQDYTDASSPINTPSSNFYQISNLYSYGNYYTWSAAMANTNYLASSNTSNTSEAADTSICPSGWHLPSSNGTNKEFGAISQNYGGTGDSQSGTSKAGDIMSNRFRSFPNNFLYSGGFLNSSAYSRGYIGFYWSRAASSSDDAYYLSFYATYFSPSGYSRKYDGLSVRCVAGTTYTIQYDGNGADNPNGMGTTNSGGKKSVKQNGIAEGTKITLFPSNFKRDGYGFIGWSTDSDAWTHFTDNDNTNDPIIYGPMEDVVVDADMASASNYNGVINLYAVWVPAEKDGNNNPVYLQEWDDPTDLTDGCATLTKTTFDDTITNEKNKITVNKNSIIALTDKRDNMVYAIAKLADDNCWMIENLRLDNQYTMGQNQNDNTVTNESLSQGYGGTIGLYGMFVGLADSESGNFKSSTTSNSVYKSSADPPVDTYNPATGTLEDIGTSNGPAYRFPRYNNNNLYNMPDSPIYTQNYTDPSSPTNSPNVEYYLISNLYSYGDYYNWSAAMANTSYLADSSTSESANTSICPTGWRLPSSNGTNKEYGTLSQNYGGTGNSQSGNANAGNIMSNRFRSFPNNFLYSGYIDNSSVGASRGIIGNYWSRSASSNSAYGLSLESTLLNPSNSNTKYGSRSVRCVVNNSYTIQYDGNGADNPNGMGETTSVNGAKTVKQAEIKDDTKTTLLPSNFKRAGYGFVGWSTDSDAWTHFTDNDNTNDPITYGPMEDVVVDADMITNYSNDKGIITMYAVWVPAEKDGNNNPVYLQEWDDPSDLTDGCATLTKTTFDDTITNEKNKITVNKNSIIALTDKRDNMVYAIAKLADDNCWMIENLRLDNQYTMGQNQNDNTVTNESLSQGYGGTPGQYGMFVGLADSESANFKSSTTANSVYKRSAKSPVDTYNPATNTLEDIGTSNGPAYRFPRYNNSNIYSLIDNPTYIQNYTDSSSPTNTPSSNYYQTQNIYSYGNYYTWSAAMASTNYYDSSSASESANTSICPTGWHLPSSSDANKEYGTLSQGYGGTGSNQDGTANAGDIMSNRFRSFPNNFLYSGYFNNSSVSNRGTSGDYWSRSADSSNNAYDLDLGSTSLNPSYSYYKYVGRSVRCIVGV